MVVKEYGRLFSPSSLPYLPENVSCVQGKGLCPGTQVDIEYTSMAEEEKAIHYIPFLPHLFWPSLKFPQGKLHFALNPKLSIPSSGLVIGLETYSELECELKPIFTSVVWEVWDVCQMAINDAQCAFWSHYGTYMF